MKYVPGVIYSLLISLVLGVLAGSIPFLWLYMAMQNENPGDATGDFILIVIPIGILLFLGVMAVSFVLLLIFFTWRAKKKSKGVKEKP